jgi:hypothetical protein
MKNWLDFSLAWSVARRSEVFAACGWVGKFTRIAGFGWLVFFSAADVI